MKMMVEARAGLSLKNDGGVLGYRFFFQAEDGIRDLTVTGVQTCALPILVRKSPSNPGWLRVLSGWRPWSRRDALARHRRLLQSAASTDTQPPESHPVGAGRSEERRVGKECRSRWSPYH